jgi:dTDP-4-amino-4,6-dideoxygalactose transaminase
MVDLSGIDKEDLLADMADLLNSTQVAEGEFTNRAESLAAFRMNNDRLTNGLTYETVAVNSCGSGLFAVASALKAKGHDYCIVPVNTFPATMLAFEQAGFFCAMADCGKDDPSMTLDALSKAFSCNPQATVVVLTHVGGCLANEYEAIAQFCKDNRLVLIEDCAHVWGVPGAVSLGDAGVFSFYPTKAIPAGEGGMIVTPNTEIRDYCKKFRNYGKYKGDDGRLRYEGFGLNLRMSEWQAVVICHQLARTPEIVERRTKAVERLARLFPEILGAADRPTNGYKFITKPSVGAKVQCGKVYASHDQLMEALHDSNCRLAYPNAFYWARNHICLPVYENGTESWTDEELKTYYLTGRTPDES